MRCFCSEQPKSLSQWLHWTEYWYNTSYQTTAWMIPFEVVYGRRPHVIIKFQPGETEVAAVSQALIDMDELLRQLKFNLQRAQQQMVKYANESRREVQFQEEDMVYLKLRPHRQNSVCTRVFQKLATRYYGPFEILKKVGGISTRIA